MEFGDIETMEIGYGITFTDEERRLLTADESSCSPDDEIRVIFLKLALEPLQCPACDAGICQRSCLPEFDPDAMPPEAGYQCPRCRARLVWRTVLFGDRRWFELAHGQARPGMEET